MVNFIISAIALGLLWGIMTLGVHLTYRILDAATCQSRALSQQAVQLPLYLSQTA